MKSSKAITLDVREDIRNGREPFAKIMQTVGTLRPGQDLVLIAPFEPRPLYGVLAQQGYSHSSKVTPDGSFEVRFTQAQAVESAAEQGTSPSPASASAPATTAPACTGTPALDVDARGLEPPQPLVKILEAVASLPKGVTLRAHTDRRPMHLYAQLAERGFVAESEEQPDGSFITYVRTR